MSVRWSLLALRRMSEVVDYISRDRPEAARKWADGVFAAVGQLERFPGQGRVVPEVGRPSIRELIHGEYRVILQSPGEGGRCSYGPAWPPPIQPARSAGSSMSSGPSSNHTLDPAAAFGVRGSA